MQKLWLRAIYNRIILHGTEQIPQRGPLILLIPRRYQTIYSLLVDRQPLCLAMSSKKKDAHLDQKVRSLAIEHLERGGLLCLTYDDRAGIEAASRFVLDAEQVNDQRLGLQVLPIRVGKLIRSFVRPSLLVTVEEPVNLRPFLKQVGDRDLDAILGLAERMEMGSQPRAQTTSFLDRTYETFENIAKLYTLEFDQQQAPVMESRSSHQFLDEMLSWLQETEKDKPLQARAVFHRVAKLNFLMQLLDVRDRQFRVRASAASYWGRWLLQGFGLILLFSIGLWGSAHAYIGYKLLDWIAFWRDEAEPANMKSRYVWITLCLAIEAFFIHSTWGAFVALLFIATLPLAIFASILAIEKRELWRVWLPSGIALASAQEPRAMLMQLRYELLEGIQANMELPLNEAEASEAQRQSV